MTTFADLDRHRRREQRTLTAASTVVCGIGFAGAVSPTVEHTLTVALAVLAALGALVMLARWVLCRARERREDAADTLAGAAWRAAHLPHPAHQVDGQLGERARAGVAR